MITEQQRLKYLTYRRLADSGGTLFPGEYFFNKKVFDFSLIKRYISGENVGLYIHIPFCLTECLYCACFKTAQSNRENIEKYLENLIHEFKLYYQLNDSKKFKFDTIAIGGGTPSLLTEKDIEYLFSHLYKYIDRGYIKQISVEVNPYLFTESKILALKSVGVSRISIGIQSFDENVLKLNNRNYVCFEDVRDIVSYIKNQGIYCVGDLLIGIKGQSFDTCIKDYKQIRKLGLEGLTVNYFYSNIRSKYWDTLSLLKTKMSFKKAVKNPYEGFGTCESLQDKNMIIKKGYSVLGIGVGAISVYGSKYLTKKSDYDSYYDLIGKDKIPYDSSLAIDDYFVALRHLLNHFDDGRVSIADLDKKYGVNFLEHFDKEIYFLVEKDIIKLENGDVVFLKNKLITQIHFSCFFEILLDQKKFIEDYKSDEEISLDITLLSLIDEV